MNPTDDAGSGTRRLGEFQGHGNAAERYERWVVPFVVGPWVPALLDLAELRSGERVLDIATEPASSPGSQRAGSAPPAL